MFNYKAFELYSEDLFNKIETYKADIKNISTPIYKELKNDKNRIRLAIEWQKFNESERDLSIKKIYNSSYKQNFLARIVGKKIKLTEEELEFADYLTNYVEAFNMQSLNNIVNYFLDTDIIIANEFIKRNYSTHNELIMLLLESNFIEFKDSMFDKIIFQFEQDYTKINQPVLERMSNFSNQEHRLMDLYLDLKIEKKDFIEYVLYFYIDKTAIDKALSISTYFNNNENNYENVKDSLGKKYEESAKYVYSSVKRNIASDFRDNNLLYGEYSGLIGQAELKRRKSIKIIFDRYSDAIRTIFPVILMTPDVVSTVFKLKKELFDYVIFDEASQMFIERAVPAIQRAKTVIVAGDSKQLKPSSVFTSRLAEAGELDDDDDVSNIELEALDKESLLEMAKEKYKSKMIQFHYRSEHEELIEFSSSAFYERKLFFASKIDDIGWEKPIEVIKIENGFWTTENTNPIEAEEVLNLVLKLLKIRKHKETIGIITFNIKQKELIQDLLEDSENIVIRKEMERINSKTGEDESLFVKNIENVQGDERDIIIFSIGYAKNKEGRVRAQFGLLNRFGGENRLNVAITRAKKKIFIIKSINANQLQVNEKIAGPLRLKQYLEFVEYVDQMKIKEKQTLLNLICDFKDVYVNELSEFDSPFEQEVFNELERIVPKNFIIRNQVNVGGFFIDFALYDKNSEKFILGIECDGYRWHSKPEDKEKDFYRQQYLESRGWKIHRILSTNWWKNKSNELEKVKLTIDAIITKQ